MIPPRSRTRTSYRLCDLTLFRNIIAIKMHVILNRRIAKGAAVNFIIPAMGITGLLLIAVSLPGPVTPFMKRRFLSGLILTILACVLTC